MANKDNFNQWTLTLLRAVLGVIFIYHGYLKLFAPKGFESTVGFFTAISMPFPAYSALLAAVVEFVGGILLLIGLLTRWTALFLIIEMAVAFFKVHLKQGFIISPPAYGYEFILLIVASLVVIMLNGAGNLSVGKGYFKSRHLQ